MKALVTGSHGLIGRHMSAELERRGWTVERVDIANPDDPRDCRWLFDYDVTRYDLVAHAAYWVGGRAAIDGNRALLARNLELDAALFDWAARTRQHRILYFSSSAAYPIDLQRGHEFEVSSYSGHSELRRTPGYGRLREDDIDPESPRLPDADYGFAKAAGERLARNANTDGIPVHVVRPFSGYSADQSPDYPFRAFLDRMRRREDPFPIWGDGQQVRDWINVDDVIAGALAVVDADHRDPVNLCTGVGTSMRDLAAAMCFTVGYQPEFDTQPAQPSGVAYRVGDPALMNTMYTAKVDIGEGIARALKGA